MKPKDMSEHLSVDELRAKYSYDPETGVFIKKALTKYQKEWVAGCKDPSGYVRICINGRIYLAHRLAWYYMTGFQPINLIDHINGNKQDNRFVNLREADYSQNMMNSRLASNNRSGCKGVSWLSRKKAWRAEGKIDGKRVFLGQFKNLSDAISAYQKFAKENHAEFYLDTTT